MYSILEHNHSLMMSAPTRSLKSSKVGADMTLAGRSGLDKSLFYWFWTDL